MKRMVDDAKSSKQKALKKEEYRKTEVKSSLRKDKREWANNIAEKAEDAARQGQMKGVYEAARKLCNERPKQVDMLKDREGKLLSKEDEVRKRWQEHFMEVLNRPDPETVAEVLDDSDISEQIEERPVTKLEIKNAIKDMKNGKAAGIDNITVEMMKADIDTTVNVLHDLLRLIWEEERIPEDWCKGLIVKLPKKGDLTNCGNWRGITLMPTAAKVMRKVIIKRISRGVDKKLRKERGGFRSGRSTIEQIFVLRNIIEQSVEWNASLYICFVDYEKAFDSVHRETLLRIMGSYGIPPKLVRMVQAMYNGSKCAVIDGGGKTDWFDIKSGVRQGCVMLGFLFLLVIDWVMRKTLREGSTGIRWRFTEKLEDLDFADDLALLSSTRRQLQLKNERLRNASKGTGLKINIAKAKVTRFNAASEEKVTVNGEELGDVDSFVYLGAKVKSNVIAVLLYGCKSWRMTKGDEAKLDTFQQKCLRRLLKIYWPMRVSNEEVRRKANTETIRKLVRKKRWA